MESGRKNNRPEMAKAIVDTRTLGATLLVTEISHLARSAYFTSKLMEKQARFKACDIPNADEFTINILVAVAQKGTRYIAESTKRGLSAKKVRGFTLGKPENFTAASRALGRAVVQRNAQEALPNKQARRLAMLLRRDGLTLATIAAELNAHGTARPKASRSAKLRCYGCCSRLPRWSASRYRRRLQEKIYLRIRLCATTC